MATGGLEHPGIVPVYALGHGPDGRPFYAMRFVKGDSLKQAIEEFHKRDNPNRSDPGTHQLALRQLLGRFIDICNAMEYAHSRGVLHRDLKPGNIMVGKYGETLIVDWGLAKSVGRKEIVSDEATLRPASALSSSGQTRPGSAIGTPAYMSPEQAAGRLDELGPASDVYSLGATLYHLLCGKAPFDKKDLGDILQEVQRGDFPRPRSVEHKVPLVLEAICLKAMALKPTDRYEKARSLADDLEHWLADEPVTAAPDTLSEQVSRFARKHRGYVRAGAVAVILVAIVSIVAAIQINSSRHAALELADKNERLANAERDAKSKAQGLAIHNAQLAKNEQQARLRTERQLRVATAERLATISYSKRSESPELSLLLAVESGRATRFDEEGLLSSSHRALLDSLAGIGGRPLIGHLEPIYGVAISPDSRWIVTGSGDKTVRVWDLSAEYPVKPRVLSGHQDSITSVAISSDSRWVVSGSSDKTARVWDLSAENLVANPRVLNGHRESITSVTISSDSRWVVTGSYDNTARIWDLFAENPAANPRVLTGHQGEIWCVAISPNGRWIVTGSADNTARVWDLTAKDPIANPHVLSGHQDYVVSVAISPDSRWVITGSWDHTARVWDLTSDNPPANPRILSGHQGFIRSVAISPDSRWVVTGSDDMTARVWDVTSDNPAANPRVLSGHQDSITSVAITLDRRWIVTASADKTARIWDLTAETSAANPPVQTGHRAYITRNSRVLSGHQANVTSVAISPDSRWIVTGSGHDNTARVWELAAVDPVANPRILSGHQYAVTDVRISSDGRWIVTGSRDSTARVWDLTTSDPAANSRILSGHQGYITSVAISPDSRWVVTGSWDMMGESDDTTARVWDLTAENPAANPRLLSGHQDSISSVAISPDGRWIVTGSDDNTARVWDLTAENPAANPRLLSGHQKQISRVVISPNSRWVVTGSGDNTARVWDLTVEDPTANVCMLSGHHAGPIVAISPDARWIVTGSSDKTARVWRWQWDDLVTLAGKVGRNFDPVEWNQYFPGEPYRKTFPDLPIPGDP